MSPSASTPPPSPAPSAADASERRAARVHVLKGWRRAPAILAGLLVRVWCATLRIRLHPNSRRLFDDTDPRPTLFVLWHNRLFIAAELSRRLRPARPLHGLVSASKDGAWLSAFFESAGLRVVRGSSSRGGREAAAALVDVLRAGHDAGLTPDGPRGPIYVCKPGAIVVARRAHARVVLIGILYRHAWSLRSWDRFRLPFPFSEVHVSAQLLTDPQLEADNARERMEAALLNLNADDPANGSQAESPLAPEL